LSRLTQILIILVVVFSLLLCGIVVSYVANADNYKQKYDSLKADKDSLSKKVQNLTEQVNQEIERKKALEDKLNAETASLAAEISKIQGSLENTEREKSSLLQRVNSWASIVEDFSKTTDEQGQLLKNTLEELKNARAEQIKDRKELNETTATLVEKMAIIETLDAETKRLLEEKTELQNRMDKLLRPAGKAAAPAAAVTPVKEAARPAQPEFKDIELKGLITAIDLKNSIASISIGTADGVKEGMRFHVTRGDEFLCDILIIDVDAEEAVGVLELVQQQPKIGDNVSTNL